MTRGTCGTVLSNGTPNTFFSEVPLAGAFLFDQPKFLKGARKRVDMLLLPPPAAAAADGPLSLILLSLFVADSVSSVLEPFVLVLELELCWSQEEGQQLKARHDDKKSFFFLFCHRFFCFFFFFSLVRHTPILPSRLLVLFTNFSSFLSWLWGGGELSKETQRLTLGRPRGFSKGGNGRTSKKQEREGEKMKDTTTDFGFSCGFPSSVDDWVCTEAPFAPKRHTDDQSGKMEMFKVQHVADQRFKSRGQGQGREEKRNILFTRGLNKKMKLIIFFFFFSVVFQMRAF